MINKIEINSIEEIVNLFKDRDYDVNINRYRSSYLYRGIKNSSYKLETTLYRNCKDKQYDVEESMLRNFAKYAMLDDPKMQDSVLRQLIIGQHHGLPTRLLDWTYSPMIGLHFAISEEMSKIDEHDSVLWKIDINEINSLLPEIYKKTLEKERAYLFTVNMLPKFNLKDYDEAMGDRSFILIEPPSIDQRIINQYSYFSVIPKGITDFEDFLDKNTNNSTKYIINKDIKWEIRDMLDEMNMNERIFFPGLDGLSQWIKRHYYVK